MADSKRDKKISETDPDELVELIEESKSDRKPVSSVEKPRRGVLWGAL
jgi:hypothetical protein